MDSVWFSAIRFKALRDRIRAEEVDIDEQTLADTVEGLTDLQEIIAAVVRSAIADEALAGGLRDLIKEMQGRLSRFEERAVKKRRIARDVMREVDLTKITKPDITVTLRAGARSVVVLDAKVIPDEFWQPQERLLMRRELLTELKSGKSIAGAELSKPELVLNVRVS